MRCIEIYSVDDIVTNDRGLTLTWDVLKLWYRLWYYNW